MMYVLRNLRSNYIMLCNTNTNTIEIYMHDGLWYGITVYTVINTDYIIYLLSLRCYQQLPSPSPISYLQLATAATIQYQCNTSNRCRANSNSTHSTPPACVDVSLEVSLEVLDISNTRQTFI